MKIFSQMFTRGIFLISETIIAFAWEPNGSKFAVLHGEAPRISVSFYHVKNNGKIELISKWLVNLGDSASATSG